jgi:hypothetical protein
VCSITFLSFPILLHSGELEVTPTASSRKSKLERATTFDMFGATQEDGGGEYIAVRSALHSVEPVLSIGVGGLQRTCKIYLLKKKL